MVGFAAGGSTDVLARLLAQRLGGKYAPTVLVDNKPGASDSPAGFSKAMATELERWKPIVQASGFTAEE